MARRGPSPALDEDAIRVFLKLRADAQLIFPGFFVTVRDRVQERLADLGAKGVVGEFDREKAMVLFPELGYRVPVDWVAFGFPELAFYDAHIGVILETSEWPVKAHVGLHLTEALWRQLRTRIDSIDWTVAVGRTPEHSVAGSVREHRLCDAARLFDFAAIERESDDLAERAVAYYRAVFAAITDRPRQ